MRVLRGLCRLLHLHFPVPESFPHLLFGPTSSTENMEELLPESGFTSHDCIIDSARSPTARLLSHLDGNEITSDFQFSNAVGCSGFCLFIMFSSMYLLNTYVLHINKIVVPLLLILLKAT